MGYESEQDAFRPFLARCDSACPFFTGGGRARMVPVRRSSCTAFDTSGAVVAGAHVKVRDLNTSFAASTTTNDHGMFRFAVLPVGQYELTADHAGFATAQVNKIDLTVGANLTLTLRFSVASLALPAPKHK